MKIVSFYGTPLEARQFLFDTLNEDADCIRQYILYGPSSPKEIKYENRGFSTCLNYSDFFVNYFAKRLSSLDWYENSEETEND